MMFCETDVGERGPGLPPYRVPDETLTLSTAPLVCQMSVATLTSAHGPRRADGGDQFAFFHFGGLELYL